MTTSNGQVSTTWNVPTRMTHDGWQYTLSGSHVLNPAEGVWREPTGEERTAIETAEALIRHREKLRLKLVENTYDLQSIDKLRKDGYIFKYLINKPSLTFEHSDPGGGKSVVTLDMCFHAALGWPWCGYKAGPRVKSLYLYGEGISRLWKRRDAWLSRHPQVKMGHVQDYLHFMPVSLPLLDEDPEAFDSYIEHVIVGNYDMVVVDPWILSVAGADQNQAGPMAAALKRVLRLISETEAAVIIIHHDNKAGDFLGSVAVSALSDTRIHLERTSGRNLKLSLPKERDEDDSSIINGHLEVVYLPPDAEGDPISSVVFVNDTVPYSDLTPAERKQAEALTTLKACTRVMWRVIQHTWEPNDPVTVTALAKDLKDDALDIGFTPTQRKRAIEHLREIAVVTPFTHSGMDAKGRARSYEALRPVIHMVGGEIVFTELTDEQLAGLEKERPNLAAK